jgi:hypothetical protein
LQEFLLDIECGQVVERCVVAQGRNALPATIDLAWWFHMARKLAAAAHRSPMQINLSTASPQRLLADRTEALERASGRL